MFIYISTPECTKIPKISLNFEALKDCTIFILSIQRSAFHSGGREFGAWPGWRSFDSLVPVGSQTPVEFNACYSDGT